MPCGLPEADSPISALVRLNPLGVSADKATDTNNDSKDSVWQKRAVIGMRLIV